MGEGQSCKIHLDRVRVLSCQHLGVLYHRVHSYTWDTKSRTATTRYFIVDAATGTVSRMGDTMQAYTDQEYCRLLEDLGFVAVALLPSFEMSADQHRDNLLLITAKPPTGV